MDARASWIQDDLGLRLEQPQLELGPEFCVVVAPEGLPAPRLGLVSVEAAALLGLAMPDAATAAAWAERFSGNRLDPASPAICTAYAGHQFGNWAGRLGDGRAHLLGEAAAADPAQAAGHARWEVQIKGGGHTPYSRHGDGRAVLRSSLREFLASEAMWHLGIPTTRALCLVHADLAVPRETLETAAVVTRLAPTFIRFGHFELFAFSGRHDRLRQLADWTIARVDPGCARAEVPALALLQGIVARTAELIAAWQAVGFIHGVMNTDNMSVLGWTLDYGPFAFMDGFDPDHTPNTTDRFGRYAWARQPAVARWNLQVLGGALLPLIGQPQPILDAIARFEPACADALGRRLRAKLGLDGARADDDALIQRWLELLAAHQADWTLSHRALAAVDADASQPLPAALRRVFGARADTDPQLLNWLREYRARLRLQPGTDAARQAAMNRVNPQIVLRHHLGQQVIAQARAGDFAPAAALLDALRRPFDTRADDDPLAAPPPDDAPPPALSCSS